MQDQTNLTTSQPEWLFAYKDPLDDEQVARIEYDREGDMLEIFFAQGAGTGLELNDEIVLRYDPETNSPLSLIFITFSKLIQPTEYGIESFQLTGIEQLTPLRRNQIFAMLTSSPINHYLHVSAFSTLQEEEMKLVPITYMRQELAAAL